MTRGKPTFLEIIETLYDLPASQHTFLNLLLILCDDSGRFLVTLAIGCREVWNVLF